MNSNIKNKDMNKEQLISELGKMHKRIVKLEELKIKNKLMEIALYKSKERYRRITNAITDYIYTVYIQDSKMVDTVHSPACVSVTGYTAEELQKNPYLWIQMVYSKDRSAVEEYVKSVLSGVNVKALEHRIIKKDGTLRWVRNTSVLHYDNKGRLLSYDGIIQDITEQKKLQEQLVQSEKLSVAGQLASGIAHEVNNILSVILGNTQLLKMNQVNKTELLEYLNIIENQTKLGSEIVSNLMTFVRPTPPKKDICNITDIIDEVLKLQIKYLTLENIKVIKDYALRSSVEIDKGQFKQVFLNLFINSRHAMLPKGQGKIKISIKEVDDKIEIRFSDTGIGMDEKTKSKIFNPFFTTKETKEEEGYSISGTGLGLSVCYTIIQNHNGSITFESKENAGTTFTITLPITKKDKKSKKKGNIKFDEYYSEKMRELRILIIDDEKLIRDLLSSLFFYIGIKNTVIVDSGEEAISVFSTNKFDVVILDLLMPGINGSMIFDRLKEIDQGIPVIFISGRLGIKKKSLLSKGAYDFIKKPFEINEIINVLNRFCEDG